jgi:predicted O-methyltransferase YrrM
VEKLYPVIGPKSALSSEGYEAGGDRPEGWFTEEEGAFYLETVQQYRDGIAVELGVWLGRSLSYILPTCRRLNITVYAVDPWKLCSIDLFKANLARMNASDQVRILHMESFEAAAQFLNESVDVLMIDTSHEYEDTIREIDAWWPKLKVGGDMLLHDYCYPQFKVREAVDLRFGKPDELRCSLCLIRKASLDRKRS